MTESAQVIVDLNQMQVSICGMHNTGLGVPGGPDLFAPFTGAIPGQEKIDTRLDIIGGIL